MQNTSKSRLTKTSPYQSLGLGLSLCLSLGLSLSTIGFSGLNFSSARAEGTPSWKSDYEKGLASQADQKPSDAVNHFHKALTEMQHEPHTAADLEQCMSKLGNAQMLHGQTQAAQTTYNSLLNLLTKRYGISSDKVSPILVVLGSLEESLGDHANAMIYYHKALRNNEKNYGAYSPQFADSLRKIGQVHQRTGNKAGAIKNYKRALSILSGEPGLEASGQMRLLLKDYNDLIKDDDSSNAALIKDFDSDIYGDTKKAAPVVAGVTPPQSSAWQQRDQFQLQAEARSQTNEDPEVQLRGIDKGQASPSTDQNLSPIFKTMSDTIFRQSHFEKGEEYYKRKIAVDVQSLGPAHPTLANDLCGLAVLYNSEQKYSLARPLLERALPIYQKAWGDNNVLTINTMATLATSLFHSGQVDRAASMYKEALSRGQSALGPNNLETARILNDLAYLNFHQGKLNEACTFYEWALASTESAVGQKDPLVAACLQDYAQVLKSLGRASEAQAKESRAQAILASTHQGSTN